MPNPEQRKRTLSIIVAVSENGVIGRGGTLPWRLPADLKYFRRVTTGHAVVMGRKNFEDIGRPLPDRRNIVLTRDSGFRAEGCLVARSIEQAITLAGDDPEIFFIGGAELYTQILPRADRLYLTRVHASIEGDTYFPEFSSDDWIRITRERRDADADNPYDLSFDVFERRPTPS